MSLKRSRFGIKGFVIADSVSSYEVDTLIYTPKEGAAESRDLSSQVVLKMTEPYVNKGYRLFVDNWYTSVPQLGRRGILACGTARPNGKYLPQDIVDQQYKQVKSPVRGESLFRQSGSLVYVTWRDKTVHLLSTLPEGLEIGQVERKVKFLGQWQRRNFAQPKLIKLYNSHMGGVDLGDQCIATCSRLMKGNILCYKILFHMLQVAALNSHIMYQRASHQGINLIKFKESLAHNPIDEKFLSILKAFPLELDICFNCNEFHHPVAANTQKSCKVHIQRVETVYECFVCQVRM